ncbi:hypothetical protein BKA81DRAFT_353701 [Phyllosticta paracitricarpa]
MRVSKLSSSGKLGFLYSWLSRTLFSSWLSLARSSVPSSRWRLLYPPVVGEFPRVCDIPVSAVRSSYWRPSPSMSSPVRTSSVPLRDLNCSRTFRIHR